MKIALLMRHNIYHGREYMSALLKNGIRFDVLSFGNFPDRYDVEDNRCEGIWNPESFDSMIGQCANHYNFSDLSDRGFRDLLKEKQYDFAIQGGGVGILKEKIIKEFKLGILNFHPGDLPKYRGCSAPEWQIVEGNRVVVTCHLVDQDIDSGDILEKKELDLDYSSYAAMRASIYPNISQFVVEVVQKIISGNGEVKFIKQDDANAIYREYIGDEIIEKLKKQMDDKLLFTK